ncbi:hypothetical protein [Nesterenkonia alba]|uniref:hypothetical protein n=1 Tax=Nesterenkonia alba TaxID=515814 RepID=UPI0003B3C584|nr:hypothetical protein [Nesterenkonia alba]
MTTTPPEEPRSTGSKYGTEAYQPGAYSEDISQPPQYRQLLLWTLLSMGFYLAVQILGMVPIFTGEMQDILREDMAEVGTAEEIDQLMELFALFGIGWYAFLAVAALILYLVVYFGLKNKKNWARILGIVLALLGLVFTLGELLLGVGTAFASATLIIGSLITLVWASVTVFWLILAFNGRVAKYIQQFSAPPKS